MRLFLLLIMFLSRLLNKEGRNNQQTNPNAQKTVCNVEGGPVIGAPIDVNKIPHPAILEEPVVEIPANAGGEKPQGDMNKSVCGPAEKKYEQDSNDGNY